MTTKATAEAVEALRKASMEIYNDGHMGWGNACIDAAIALEDQSASLAAKETELQEAAMKHVSLFGELQNATDEIARLREACAAMVKYDDNDHADGVQMMFEYNDAITKARAALTQGAQT